MFLNGEGPINDNFLRVSEYLCFHIPVNKCGMRQNYTFSSSSSLFGIYIIRPTCLDRDVGDNAGTYLATIVLGMVPQDELSTSATTRVHLSVACASSRDDLDR